MSEHIVFGPPGTGKSTYATRQIRRAAEKYGADKVMACSFTRAAAVELATKEVDGRKSEIPKQMIGTLHSLCYRALDAPALAEANIKDFNDAHPEYRLTETRKPDVDDLGAPGEADGGAASADALLARYQLLRARCVERAAWPETVRGFAHAWEIWKEAHDALDFTDLIEHAPEVAPGNPRVIFGDEAQDFNRLQMNVLRKWGGHVESLVLLGDDDQTIHSFAGAHASNMLDSPGASRIVLKQSYRIPATVHRYSQRWIERVKQRQPKEFLPRDAEGIVRGSDASIRHPEAELETVRKAVAEGRTAMILASCGYMLRGWIAALQDAGIGYHNPYRPARGDWNPLSRKEGGAAARLSSFLAADNDAIHWTMYNLNQFCAVLKAGGLLKRGAKAEIERLAEERPGYRPSLAEMGSRWLETPLLDVVSSEVSGLDWPNIPAMEWLIEHALPARAGPLRYAASIAAKAMREGREPRAALAEAPLVTVGTVHSVKGAEAHLVLLAPDLSPQAAEHWAAGRDGADEIRRTLYVGMTRAREELVLLRPGSGMSVEL